MTDKTQPEALAETDLDGVQGAGAKPKQWIDVLSVSQSVSEKGAAGKKTPDTGRNILTNNENITD
ncbi:MAG: hypothetical protein AAF334_04820 [Pseudomonadota bacterium]